MSVYESVDLFFRSGYDAWRFLKKILLRYHSSWSACFLIFTDSHMLIWRQQPTRKRLAKKTNLINNFEFLIKRYRSFLTAFAFCFVFVVVILIYFQFTIHISNIEKNINIRNEYTDRIFNENSVWSIKLNSFLGILSIK